MGKLGKDAKDLIVGNDGSEKEPDDFSVELKRTIKNDINFTAENQGKTLTTAREKVDKKAKELDKKWIDAAVKINLAKEYESAEEEQEAIKKKKRKEEEKRIKEIQVTQEQSKIKQDNVKKVETQREREKIK